MKKLMQHDLIFEKAYKFVKDRLKDVNIISIELLKMVDFERGNFFTLMPKEFNEDQLYKFSEGGILPQNPEKEYFLSRVKATYSVIPTIRDELAAILIKLLKNNKGLICIIDDIHIPNQEFGVEAPIARK